ncbi:hypothetical protein GCM10011390_47880 [Aureimonas endophytica]|uniref:Multidrug resistance efflux pump n=1 Tax=Aureimonas endophytica TaxID=2027858 RepID=A0A917A366_9HYPH|nr:HlyD family efflux transporter periplasmic adaptor subunit [Aureimonas endophytica]GGE22885.1 hypothetical protein GCM10011390_47880 [Aureimonas endophytica]
MSIVALDLDERLAKAPRISLASASGKRMHQRVDRPLTIGFADGRLCEAVDWSISGFSLEDGCLGAAEGSIHAVKLFVPLAGCSVLIAADAKVTWTAGPYARGLRFIDLAPEKARIIDHFIQSGVEGEVAVIGGLPVAQTEVGPARRRSRLWRDLGQAAKLACLAAIVVAGGGFAAARLLTVTTDYAAIAGDLQQLHAPEAGYLVGDRLMVGSRVRLGERIASIRPLAGPRARLSTETQIAALQADLEQQKRAFEQASAGFATFVQASRTDFVEATANRQLLEAQVETETRAYQRLAGLKAKDVVGQQRLDQEEQTLNGLKRSLSAAKAAEETAGQKLANAEAGRFNSDGRSTQKAPADFRQAIDTTEATIARLRTVLAGLDEPLPIVSPCDCTVSAIAATPGTYILSGARIAELVRDGTEANGTVVDALVQNPRLNLVRQGQAVTVYLADRSEGVAGHVVAVNFNPGDTGRAGLPTSLRTLDDYGLMTVRLDRPIAGAPVGLPASVMAPVGFAALAARLPGARWGLDAFDRFAGWLRPGAPDEDPLAIGKADRLAGGLPPESV